MYCSQGWTFPCPDTYPTVTGSTSPRPATTPGPTTSCSAYHPGGVNCLFGDGSVKFLKDSTSVVVLRSLVTLSGGEVISSDSF